MNALLITREQLSAYAQACTVARAVIRHWHQAHPTDGEFGADVVDAIGRLADLRNLLSDLRGRNEPVAIVQEIPPLPDEPLRVIPAATSEDHEAFLRSVMPNAFAADDKQAA